MGKFFCSCLTFLSSQKFHKIKNYSIVEQVQKKFGPTVKEFWYFFNQKLSLGSQEYGLGIRDPVTGKNLSQIQVSGSPIPDQVSGSRILNRNIALMQAFLNGTVV
jgi:hypothetical protein